MVTVTIFGIGIEVSVLRLEIGVFTMCPLMNYIKKVASGPHCNQTILKRDSGFHVAADCCVKRAYSEA